MPRAQLVQIAGAALAVAAFGLGPIADRFAPQEHGEIRFEAWPHVLAAADGFLPFGSGLGSFDRVYQSVEPLNLVAVEYLNHAHNEYLELWLETGWVGAAIFGLFVVWLAASIVRAWRSGGDGLARGAGAAILLLMAASVVDYPLRTEALVVLFAFCCGLLARQAPGFSYAPAR
jgi:O-antigen ligase